MLELLFSGATSLLPITASVLSVVTAIAAIAMEKKATKAQKDFVDKITKTKIDAAATDLSAEIEKALVIKRMIYETLQAIRQHDLNAKDAARKKEELYVLVHAYNQLIKSMSIHPEELDGLIKEEVQK